jgi:hypothetical protein
MAAGQVIYSPGHIILPVGPPGSGAPLPDAAPSIRHMGIAVQDPRVPYTPGAQTGNVALIGHYLGGMGRSGGEAPSTISTSNIAANQHTVTLTPLNLVTTSGSGITVTSTPFLCFGSNNTIPTGTLVIDGLPTYGKLGSGFITGIYDPAACIGRAVSVTAAAGATATTMLIKGADIYGYPMSQLVTISAGATVNTLKTFKFIYSATPTGTDSSHNYSIGTADIFGFPVICNHFSDCLIYWSNLLQVFSTYTVPDATTPATTATGDVRGTWTNGGSASNGTIRLDMLQMFTLGMFTNAAGPAVGIYGVAQV